MIEKQLVIKLCEVAGLNNRVFPLVTKQNQEVPYIVYDRIQTSRERTLSGYAGLIETYFQLDLYEKSYTNLKSISADVIAKLETFEGSTLGSFYIQSAVIENEYEAVEDDKDQKWYRTTIELKLSYEGV
jgi:hypothetical protein